MAGLRPALKPHVVGAAAGVAVIIALGIGLRLLSSAAGACTRIVLPAYWYPDAAWTTAINSMPAGSFLILDISGSGAGDAVDNTFKTYVQQAQAKGIKVIGYDDTTYAARAAATVELEVQHYKAWYNVTDIFLDQVSSGTADLSYYQTIYSYIHSYNPGSTVMLNPGVYPAEQYMTVGDILMVFEDTYANYVNASVPAWARNYPATRFVHTVHDTSSAQWQNALSLAQNRNAGYVLITNGTGANPYAGLPSYWSSEVQALAATCTATPTPTPAKPGDLNNDGKVDVLDLSVLLSAWGTANTTADVNKDGSVNFFDLSILLAHWGT
jgi:hypothetical protein